MTVLATRRTAHRPGRPLVLLHGLGATAEALAPLAGAADAACVLVDLPGHGGSAGHPLTDLASACRAVADAVPELAEAVVVGHSLGGVVGLGLAAGLGGTVPAGVVALSMKAHWTDDDVARARALAARERTRFPTRAEAEERFLRVAGLAGVLDTAALRASGVRQDGDAWVLVQDPASNGFVPPDLAALRGDARCPVVVATGAEDPVAPPEVLRAVDAAGVVVSGAGHALPVQSPEAVLDLVRSLDL